MKSMIAYLRLRSMWGSEAYLAECQFDEGMMAAVNRGVEIMRGHFQLSETSKTSRYIGILRSSSTA